MNEVGRVLDSVFEQIASMTAKYSARCKCSRDRARKKHRILMITKTTRWCGLALADSDRTVRCSGLCKANKKEDVGATNPRKCNERALLFTLTAFNAYHDMSTEVMSWPASRQYWCRWNLDDASRKSGSCSS